MTRLTGKFILLIGPSGSGKGTIGRHVKRHHKFQFPISCTTRDKRPREREGQNYYFINKIDFLSRIEQKDFLEWAQVHNDNYYGTLKSEVLPYLERGETVFREIDIQGADLLDNAIPAENIVKIFVTAKNWTQLSGRIQRRAAITPTELEARHQSFITESKYAEKCDFTIINENHQLTRALKELEEILKSITKN